MHAQSSLASSSSSRTSSDPATSSANRAGTFAAYPEDVGASDEDAEEISDYARLMAKLDGEEEGLKSQLGLAPPDFGRTSAAGGSRRPSTSAGEQLRLNGSFGGVDRSRQMSNDSGRSISPALGNVHRRPSTAGDGAASNPDTAMRWANSSGNIPSSARRLSTDSDGTDASSMSLRERRMIARARKAQEGSVDLPRELVGSLASISTARPPPRTRPARNPARQSVQLQQAAVNKAVSSQAQSNAHEQGLGGQETNNGSSEADVPVTQPGENDDAARRRLLRERIEAEQQNQRDQERDRLKEQALRVERQRQIEAQRQRVQAAQVGSSRTASRNASNNSHSGRSESENEGDLRRAYEEVSEELHHTHIVENRVRGTRRTRPEVNAAAASRSNRSSLQRGNQQAGSDSDAGSSVSSSRDHFDRRAARQTQQAALVHHANHQSTPRSRANSTDTREPDHWDDTLTAMPPDSMPPLPSYDSVLAQQRYQEQQAAQQVQSQQQRQQFGSSLLPTIAGASSAQTPSRGFRPVNGIDTAVSSNNSSAQSSNNAPWSPHSEGAYQNYSATEYSFSGGGAQSEPMPGESVENLHDSPHAARSMGGLRAQRGSRPNTESDYRSESPMNGPHRIAAAPRYGTDDGWQGYLQSNSSQESATSSLRIQPGIPVRPQAEQRNSAASSAALSRVVPLPQSRRSETPGSNRGGPSPSNDMSSRPGYARSYSGSNLPVGPGMSTPGRGRPSQEGRPPSPDRASTAPSSRWGGNDSMSYENAADAWGTLREEDIEYEEVRETQEQLSLFGIRRRLVVMYPQLGTRALTSAWQPLETTINEEGEGELGQEILMNEKETKRKEERLESREKDLTIEACSKQEMATVTVSVYTEQREGKWTVRGPADHDGEEIAMEPPGAMDPWSVPIDSRGIMQRKKLKSNIELTATRLKVRCLDCARTMRLDLTCQTCKGNQIVEMSYVITVTLRVASFLPLKLPSLHLAGAKQPYIKYVETGDPDHRSSVLRDRALDGAQSASQRVGKQHFMQHGSRLLVAKARVERRGVLSIAVTSSKTRVRRTFDVQDGPRGKIADTTEHTAGPPQVAEARSSRSIGSRPSGSTYRGMDGTPNQDFLQPSNKSTYAPSLSNMSMMSSRSAKAKAAFKGMFGRSS